MANLTPTSPLHKQCHHFVLLSAGSDPERSEGEGSEREAGSEAPAICANCNGACCCQNGVQGLISTPFLTPEDVERIKNMTGMDESAFAIESVQVEDSRNGDAIEMDPYPDARPASGIQSNPDSGGIQSNLPGRIKQMRTKPSGHGCMFFNEETRLCRIYSARPLDCRLFPLDIIQEEGKTYLILHTELCSINPAALDAYVQYAQAHLIPMMKPYIREYSTINMELITHRKWQKLAEIDMAREVMIPIQV